VLEGQIWHLCFGNNNNNNINNYYYYYSTGNFFTKPPFDPTIHESYRRQVEVDGKLCHLNILDFDWFGPENCTQYRRMDWVLKSKSNNMTGVIIVYSITDRNSFDQVRIWMEILAWYFGMLPPVVLCGNKIDLDANREVSTKEGLDMSRKYKIPFCEISLKHQVKIDEPFYNCVREIRKFQYIHFVNHRKLVTDIVVMILCARYFDKRCKLKKINKDVCYYYYYYCDCYNTKKAILKK